MIVVIYLIFLHFSNNTIIKTTRWKLNIAVNIVFNSSSSSSWPLLWGLPEFQSFNTVIGNETPPPWEWTNFEDWIRRLTTSVSIFLGYWLSITMAVDVHDYLDRLPNMLSEARASNTPKLCYSGLLLCYLELLVNKNPIILPLKKYMATFQVKSKFLYNFPFTIQFWYISIKENILVIVDILLCLHY